MEDCIPQDNSTRKKRQADPFEVRSGGTDNRVFTTETKGKKMKRRGKANRFKILEGEDGDGSDIELSTRWKDLLRQDTNNVQWDGASSDDMLPVQTKSSQKRRKLKKILCWRKQNSNEANNTATSSEGNNHESEVSVRVETHIAAMSTAEPQPEVRIPSLRPKPSTAFDKWIAEQTERAERRQDGRDNRKMALPKTMKKQHDNERDNSARWHANRILRRRGNSKENSPQYKPALTGEQERNLAMCNAGASMTTEVEGEDFVESLDATVEYDYEHTCAICYDLMVRPHEVRPCGHIFCEVCLRQLQHSTASRLDPWAVQNQRGRRNALPERDVLVLCPICRGPIQQCKAKGELDEIMLSKYPNRYQKRQKQMQDEIGRLKCSRLPSSTTSALHRHKFLNQRAVQPRLKTLINSMLNCTWILAVIVGGCILVTYIICMILTVGLLKFCFACVGKSRSFYTPEIGTQWRPFSFNMIRGLSIVFFFGAIKLFCTLHWGQLFCLAFLTLFITTTSYSLEGKALEDIFNVVKNAVTHPMRAN